MSEERTDVAHVVHVLQDAPDVTDPVGGHAKVAKAIADVVVQDAGGLTIGLEGRWGSGKSTIVRQVCNQHPDHVTAFVFDAWSHEGDPLRRSFLESLVGRLQERGWVDNTWDSEIERLARRQRSSEQTSTQNLTRNGQLLAASALLTPIGSAVLGRALGAEDVDPWMVVASLVLIAAPLLVAIGVVTWRRVNKGQDAEPFDLFSSAEVVHQRSDTIETPDPTSVEFQNSFRKLLDDALGDPNRRLVIVLDNIDRVPAAEALQVLATLQAFTSLPEEPAWRERLWVLLPYDPVGFRSLWRRDGDDPGPDRGSEFLAKVRQVRFDAPPLVHSTWREHLRVLLHRAVPTLNGDETAELATVFAVGVGSRSQPTPRQLLQFVNDFGAILRQRPDLPLPDIATYTALRMRDVEVAEGLLAATVPEPELERVSSSEVRGSLAALHFNTDVVTGQQLLLAAPLLVALHDGDGQALQQLATNPGFESVLEQLATSELQEHGGHGLGMAGYALHSAHLLSSLRGSVLPNLLYAAKTASELHVRTTEAGLGLAELLLAAGVKDAGGAQQFADAVSQRDSDAELLDDALKGRVEGVVAFIEALSPEDDDWDLSVVLPGDASSFVVACAHARQIVTRPKTLHSLVSSVNRPDLEQVVAEWAGSPADELRNPETLRAMQASGTPPLRVRLLKEFVTYLSDESRAADESTAAVVDLVLSLTAEDSTSETLKAAANEGHLANLVERFAEIGDHRRASELGFLHLANAPTLPDVPVIGDSTGGLARVRGWLTDDTEDPGSQHLAELAADRAPSLIVAIHAGQSSTVEWCKAASDVAAQNGKLQTIATFAPHWREWRNLLSDDRYGEVLAHHIVAGSVERLLATAPEDDTGDLELDVARTAQGVSSEAARDVQGVLAERLAHRSEDEWMDELDAQTPSVRLLRFLAEQGSPVLLGVAFEKALLRHGELLASGDSTLEDPAAWSSLAESLESDDLRNDLANGLCTSLYRLPNDHRVPEGFFQAWGSVLADAAQVHRHDQLLSGVVRNAVESRNAPGMLWAAALLRSVPSILTDLQPEEKVSSLRAHVEHATSDIDEDEDGEVVEALLALAAALGLTVEN
ncbi:KAP family NTPase [Acidimicrobiia bacterium EGI L10123]|uniref:P-loop NTPase fold protein n=1 Tax=Salinilacustrithrix flava TaxID=2957203 RepID=UPI003D7C1E74|nr:KAP family NTPase [Acidimicrobiia bacterium EGI L10123]